MSLHRSFVFLLFFLLCSFLCSSMRTSLHRSNLNHQVDVDGLKQQLLSFSTIPVKMFAAQIHYSRIPYQYWQHRLKMIKSMGFNALSVYIMWNFHQIQKEKFDYQNGQRNLTMFLQLAYKYQFKVLIRPGPYVCAEWDFGGLPARLLGMDNIKIRQNDQIFLTQVKEYFKSLAPIFIKYSQKNNGPIILLQIQNQYASYGNDKTYIQNLRKMWDQLEVQIQHYYVDVYNKIDVIHWQGATIGLNDAIKQQYWVKAKEIQPKGYLFGGEIYSGWLTHWGEQWQGKTLQEYNKEFKFLMENNHSFSMYMAHGGSNFGLWAGANSYKNKSFDYRGHVTSYDYAAPINEQGSATDKFYSFRNLSKEHASWSIPQIPSAISMIKIKPFILSSFADLLQNLPNPHIKQTQQLLYFEHNLIRMYQQGFILYQTHLDQGHYDINLIVHDFGLVYLNDVFRQFLDRSENTRHHLKIQVNDKNGIRLRILVEAMGHVNFDHEMVKDRKGLIEFNITMVHQEKQNNKQIINKVNQQLKLKWTIYCIPISEQILKWTHKSSSSNHFPRLFRYNLTLNQIGDTYLNMQKWKKGYVFVNGYNLGRYWHKGPQHKLFLPGVWLKKGVNDVVVLQLCQGVAKFVQGDETLNGIIEEEIVMNDDIKQDSLNSYQKKDKKIDWSQIIRKSIQNI